MSIVRTKANQGVYIYGTRIILIEDAGFSIVHYQTGIAERSINRCNHSCNSEAQAIYFYRLATLRLDEPGKANIPQGAL